MYILVKFRPSVHTMKYHCSQSIHRATSPVQLYPSTIADAAAFIDRADTDTTITTAVGRMLPVSLEVRCFRHANKRLSTSQTKTL